MGNKIVSICIPVYNGSAYIKKTLDSIVCQTYENIEIIVSDNCSVDDTVSIVEAYAKTDSRVRVNKNDRNLGYSGNLNKLIEFARSEYVAIYHADDIYDPTIVETQVEMLERNRDVAGCFTLGRMIDGSGKSKKNEFYFNSRKITRDLVVDLDLFIKNISRVGNMFICPTSMMRKSVYVEFNGYNTTLRYIEDQDMWIRILEKYSLGLIAKELFSYRIHDNQGSSYYANPERKNLAVDLLYIENYLCRNADLKERYYSFFRKRLAKGYLVLAKNAVVRADYPAYCENVSESVRKGLVFESPRYIFTQCAPLWAGYAILRFFLTNRIR